MDNTQFWWLSIGIGAVVIVVVAVLLGMIIAAAQSIDRHAKAIWTVGKQIAGNTVSIWMLETTNERLTRIMEGLEFLDRKLSAPASSKGS
ncbi:MAG: hypothetical protein H0W86_00885 [Armatimonadetes bacterium]|nr:hypothetical protein [Armatimonadota bacterium]